MRTAFTCAMTLSTSMIRMYNDDGTDPVGHCTPGSTGTLSNSQGALDCGGTTMSGSGNNLTINWKITPSVAFASATAKNIYMYAIDNSGLQADWARKGTWMIDGTTTPTLGALTPSADISRPGIARTFKAEYSDAFGYGNLHKLTLLVNSTQTEVNGIYALYVPAEDKLYLYNDDGTDFAGSCKLGSAGKLSNTQGTLDCAATTVTKSGKNITVNWNIKPRDVFASNTAKNIYVDAYDNLDLHPGWTQKAHGR